MFTIALVVFVGVMLYYGDTFDDKRYSGSVFDNAYALYMFPKCIDFDVALGEKKKGTLPKLLLTIDNNYKNYTGCITLAFIPIRVKNFIFRHLVCTYMLF